VLRERVASFAAADLVFKKLQVLKNMRNEATEVRLDYAEQNASQPCKV
jgi:type III secretory pathway component EscU